MTGKKLTIVERILLAAKELDERGRSFSAEDLIVKSWDLFPDQFGLQGYASKHPDSNRVLTKVMGRDSVLRKRGWIRKVGTKRYQLTEVGRHAAEELTASLRPSGEARLAQLSRGFVSVLRRMLDSTAMTKYVRGDALTFSDACGYWNISPRSTAHQFADRSEEADAAIQLALQHNEQGGGRTVLPGGQEIRDAQLKLLRELSEHLREAFAGEIEVIQSRRDERRL